MPCIRIIDPHGDIADGSSAAGYGRVRWDERTKEENPGAFRPRGERQGWIVMKFSGQKHRQSSRSRSK